MALKGLLCLVAVLLVLAPSLALAKLVIVSSAQSSNEINTVLSGLNPGDEVIFTSGTYADMALRLDVSGTADDYIKIRSDNAVHNSLREKTKSVILQADPSNSDSVLKFGAGSKYIQVYGLQFEHVDKAVDENAGIRFENNVHHVTISNCVVKDITGIGIEMHDLDDVHDITIKDSAIYNIGLGQNSGVASNLGAGISAGGTGGATKNTHHLVVHNNIFHDLEGNLGSAIYFSEGVRTSNIYDNVVWNSPNGANILATKAAIYVAGGAAAAANADSNIVVKGNAVLDSVIGGLTSVAVQVGSGANVYNNLIVNAQKGIDIAATFVSNLKHTRVTHNTVFKISDTALSAGFSGNEDDTFVVANNVFYVGDSIGSLLAYVWTDVTKIGTSVVKNNYYKGQTILDQLFADAKAFVQLKGSATSFFSAPNADIGAGADFLVKGALLNAGIDVDVDVDYDNNDRDSDSPDIGCYETGAGGHFAVDYDFKVTLSSGDDSAASTIESFLYNLF